MKKSFVILFYLGLMITAPLYWSGNQVEAKTKSAQPEFRQPEQELDIVLVLDNSGSMKQNDPQFLTREVVTNFVVGFGKKSRFAMIVFDQEAKLLEPLTNLSGLIARANFLSSLEQVNYKGRFTDTPAAIERAVYELRLNGRGSALKVIILLNNGIVDTGDTARDIERTKWVKETLAQECSNEGIKIYGVGFTDKADFHLIQTLAFKTQGEYFRASVAEDIQKVFENIRQRISTLPSAELASIDAQAPVAAGAETPAGAPSTKASSDPTPAAVKARAASPAAESVALGSKAVTEPQKSGALVIFLLIGIFVLLGAVVVIMVLNRKTGTEVAPGEGPISRARHEPAMPRAELIDLKNITNQKAVKMEKNIIQIGRDTSNDVAIPEETVSSFHATVEYQGGFFYLEDQRSKNKTYLNDEEVAPYSPKKLKSGDVITINVYKFLFILPDVIPTGETALDFRGEVEAGVESPAVIRGEEISSQDASVMPEAMLIDVKNITGQKTLRLDKKVINIGRGVHNEVSIPQDSVSGSHAVIQYKEGFFYLEDQRSRNKTLLNGDEIAPHAPAKLKSGDEIMINIHKFIFLLEQQTPSGDTEQQW
jgi:pSer/pThr/pTyr-binding forkhead associated (FHA) protein/Mg-chelatase subunit ChlD